MPRYLVGLQTIQNGATKRGEEVIKYQLGSHLIRRGNQEEREEVEKKRLARLDPDGNLAAGEQFGGNTMSMMVAGVMDTCVPLSDFLEALWIRHALIAYRSADTNSEDDVFSGAYEISTPKPDAPALNLLLYYRNSEQEKIRQLAASVESRILPGMDGLVREGIALGGQIMPSEQVKRRVTADRDYLYGQSDCWGAYAIKIRFPRRHEFQGYVNGGACLGIHLDDISAIPFERTVKLTTELRTVGMNEEERVVLREKVFDHQKNLAALVEQLTDPADRLLRDIAHDVHDVLHVQTIYDRKLARSRDFWKKVKGR